MTETTGRTIHQPTGPLGATELRELFLFERLDDQQRGWLAEHGWVAEVPRGETVLAEGAPAKVLVVLLDGTISLTHRVGPDEVELTRTHQVGVYAGAVQSYLGDRAPQTYTSTLHALTDTRFFVLRQDDFSHAMHAWFPMAIHLLEGLFLAMRTSQELVGRRQQLLALGALSAGLTHELNNPAAAAVRAVATLRGHVAATRRKFAMIAHGKIDPRVLEALVDVQEEAVNAIPDLPRLTALEESEREDAVTDWLEDHGVGNAWDVAPSLVAAGLDTDLLDTVASRVPQELLDSAVHWLSATVESEVLLREINDSVTRISTLVGAVKQYSHLDRAPSEYADIHEGLSSTLAMFAGKLGGVELITDFDSALPRIPAYPAELNQVWTNLIDNALQAMDGQGTLGVRTSLDGERLLVEITDTGPGIPEELRQRIFEPFFTTKPVGQGTGLGLDIAYRIVVGRHGGDISVASRPGDTRFAVRLPLVARDGTTLVEDAP
ncbi:ATP-binding protein [Actinopolymorpha alba]|uniref:ATP-binding protein n=1 Tax=Actinopolymorpha alba TaxID=533267 RepID=UPI00037D0CF1|nr:ATP-binding protein [Actinopolymorpha alba]